ncbi:MAG: DUF2971 domain-containing protein [Gammaproteobacteria bacterium]|nr:DUF2971 domain-containing protein [Gammaproteobacteria bacterium]MBU2422135.1 DUF2971 domain-containing protein [Gammaproteobacteria bacterium]
MNRLFRYTSLPVLLDILSRRQLTLISPITWDDRNDSYYLELYKQKRKLKTLLALCFTEKAETYHLWKVFSDGIGGVCIQFNKEKILKAFDVENEIGYGPVEYSLIRDLRSQPPELEELPYLKRKPYEDEGEFRIIYESSTREVNAHSVDFSLRAIEKINLSPWIPDTVASSVRQVINEIPGCSKLRVSKTTLVENKVWKNIATKQHGITTPSTRRRR